jgi:hypothetical protein
MASGRYLHFCFGGADEVRRERISPPYEDLLAESMIFPGGLGTEEAFLLQEILGYDPFFQIRFRIWNFIMPPLLFRIILLCIVHTDVQFLRSDIDADVLHKEEKKEKMSRHYSQARRYVSPRSC